MNIVYFNAEKFYRLAYDYFTYEHNTELAEKYANMALDVDSGHLKSTILKGEILLAKNETDEALKLFLKVYKKDPENCLCLISIAKAYSLGGENKTALGFLGKVSPAKIDDEDLLVGYYDLKTDILSTLNGYKNREHEVFHMNF